MYLASQLEVVRDLNGGQLILKYEYMYDPQ
jgi:hypothetical protein